MIKSLKSSIISTDFRVWYARLRRSCKIIYYEYVSFAAGVDRRKYLILPASYHLFLFIFIPSSLTASLSDTLLLYVKISFPFRRIRDFKGV